MILPRRQSLQAHIGGVKLGADAPVVVQSMTNTDTADIAATVTQVKALAEAGSELVRITVNNDDAAAAVPVIHEKLHALQCHVPLVGDFHYNGHRLLSEHPEMAQALAKYRINPGNVGFGAKQDTQFAQMIEAALRYKKPVRIGANWGSLDQAMLAKLMDENAQLAAPQPANAVMREALVQSALLSAQKAEALGMPPERLIISCKVSRVQDLVAVYRMLAERCRYPLHLGLTEAGMGSKGIVASTAALSILLQEGIGDTIRVVTHPAAGGGSHTGGASGAGNSAKLRAASVYAFCHGLPGLWPDDIDGVSAIGRRHSNLFAHPYASLADALPRGGRLKRGGHGLHRQWPR